MKAGFPDFSDHDNPFPEGHDRTPVSPSFAFAFVESAELFLKLFELLIGELLKVHQLSSSASQRADQLVQFQMHRLGVAILCVLDDEHHEKGNDRRSRVDDQLPCVREAEHQAADGPCDDDEAGEQKGPGGTDPLRNAVGKLVKGFPGSAWMSRYDLLRSLRRYG